MSEFLAGKSCFDAGRWQSISFLFCVSRNVMKLMEPSVCIGLGTWAQMMALVGLKSSVCLYTV